MVSKLTEQIVETYKNRPTVAVLMSLGGTNAEKILADEEIRDLYDISTVVTDTTTSRAEEIAEKYGLDYVLAPVDRFGSREARVAYFNDLSATLGSKGVEACFYAGFMKITAGAMIEALPGVNSHPADLTVADANGVALYRGMHAIDLMRAGSGTIGASVHAVDHTVDTGDAFFRSLPQFADPSLTERECHELIKPTEHQMYPLALRMLGEGTLQIANMPYTYDPASGRLYTNKGEVA